MKTKDAQIVLLLQAMAGGATRNTFDVYEGLKAKNWDVRLIVSSVGVAARYQDELSNFDETDITQVAMRRAPNASDLGAYFKIRQLLTETRRNKKTILHAHSTKAGMIGHFLRPLVHASVLSPHAYRGLDPKLRVASRKIIERVEARYSSNYDRIVAEVPLEYDYALRIGVVKERLRLIPNGIEVSEDSLDKSYQRRKELPGNPTLGFVGRLVYQKNPLLFIEVLNEVVKGGCDAKAIILGEGPLKGEMVKLATRCGIAERISWRGEVPAADVYPELDLMVHTSLYEAMAYSLIEACGALVPIVATRNPGSEAIFGQSLPESLSAEHDAKALAEIALRILRDDHVHQGVLCTMKGIARGYSIENMVSRLEEEYRSLLFN